MMSIFKLNLGEKYGWLFLISAFILIYMVFFGILRYLNKIKEKNTWFDLVFILTVFIFLILPITKINNKDIDIAENRNLALKPNLYKKDELNDKYGKEFENWLNDRFRYRQKFIDIHDKIEAFLLGSVENSQAFAGKENWLFYKGDGSIALFQNKSVFHDKSMEKIQIVLEKRKRWLNAQEIEFFVFIPPDKSSVYGEFYKDGIIKVGDKNRIQLLETYLQENHSTVKINYLLDTLLQHKDKGFLYYKNDTHWTEYGAFLGYLSLMEEIKAEFPQIETLALEDMKMEHCIHPEGDLMKMLGIKNDGSYDDAYLSPVPKEGYHFSYLKNDGKEGIITYNPHKSLKVLVFRDSFSEALIPYLSETFGRVEYVWDHSFNLYQDKIMQESPDIVIHEVVSRYAYWLLADEPALKEVNK